jgi:colicin import membrane protein
MDNEKYVADQKAQIEADRVKRKEAQEASDKAKADVLRARIAELEGSVSDRSEVQVLQDRVKELEKVAPDPDAAIKAELAENVREAIAAEQNFRTRPKPLTKAEEEAKQKEADASAKAQADRIQAEKAQANRDNPPR